MGRISDDCNEIRSFTTIETSSNEPSSYSRQRPGKAWISRPTKPEQADNEEKAAYEHRWESRFWHRLAAILIDDTNVARLVGEIDEDGGKHTDEEGEEGKGAHNQAVVAVLREDDGEHLES